MAHIVRSSNGSYTTTIWRPRVSSTEKLLKEEVYRLKEKIVELEKALKLKND